MSPEPLKCPRCGGRLEPGSLSGFVRFRPDNRKFLTLKDGLEVWAEACTACGDVRLTVDPAKLANLTKSQ
jgi:hypothetical protein